MYQRKVDVDMLNAVKRVLADVSSISEQRLENNFGEKTEVDIPRIQCRRH